MPSREVDLTHHLDFNRSKRDPYNPISLNQPKSDKYKRYNHIRAPQYTYTQSLEPTYSSFNFDQTTNIFTIQTTPTSIDTLFTSYLSTDYIEQEEPICWRPTHTEDLIQIHSDDEMFQLVQQSPIKPVQPKLNTRCDCCR